MKPLSKKKQKAKREIAKIKAELIQSGEKCFFSGANGPYVAFHILGIGAFPQHEVNPRNIVLSLPYFNDNWLDIQPVSIAIKFPNIEKAFVRMKEVDQLGFNRKLRMMEENLCRLEYDNLVDKIQIEILELRVNK